MLIEQALKYHLVNTTGITDLVSTRVYFIKAPQDATQPYIALQKISDVMLHSHDGPSKLAEARFQLSCYATTYAAVKGVAAAIQAAIDGYTGTMGGAGGVFVGRCFWDNETDLGFSDDLKLYGVAVDYIISHQT